MTKGEAIKKVEAMLSADSQSLRFDAAEKEALNRVLREAKANK